MKAPLSNWTTYYVEQNVWSNSGEIAMEDLHHYAGATSTRSKPLADEVPREFNNPSLWTST